jgi:hypothetical protein
MNEENGPKKNSAALLQTIFSSGDTVIKLLTMALIVISGGGNFLATKSLTDREKANVKHALERIYDVQESVQAMDRRQRAMEQTLEEINQKLKPK